ncbi:cation diffusion facilitator family transporter [Hathewaya limosa]|uniref:Cation diffusion facilitator family transporter n=1 Tax=Hathewaya limosa TaxID=1536 RepID=A0ABU0JSA0_HATLI|nr:cation diffusion facilitator family transporter [Hathewaya limosa]MDQ0479971.1 cation diffusion facilitator family transporter [Hathewaya limosa]
MLSKTLINKFIKNSSNIKDKKVRNSYGYLAGIVGIIVNVLLFMIKFFVGFFTNSIAITADAFNNLSDSGSSLITVFSFKLSSKPADREHPFGHGRIEYLSALIVSFLVLLVGIEFIKTSISRIMNPVPLKSTIFSILLMIGSILVKIWLGYFYNFLGSSINSNTLKASAKDSFADVITTSVILFSLISSNLFNFPIDGYIGVIVSIFIIYSGFSLIKETINPLLGEAPSEELVENIKNTLLSYENILDTHDLIVHNYGPGRIFASIHAEVPSNISLVQIHETIDKAEKEIGSELNILLVIHMDPVNIHCEEVKKDKEMLLNILKNYVEVKSIHDFRVVGEGEIKNLIFDLVIKLNKNFSKENENELINNIIKDIKKIHPHYSAIITIDKDFLGV